MRPDSEQDTKGLASRQIVPNPTEVNDFHRYSDSDGGPEAQHHTLGMDDFQSSPGGHTHNGRDSKQLTGGAFAGAVGASVIANGSTAPVTFTPEGSRFLLVASIQLNSGQNGELELTAAGTGLTAVMNTVTFPVGGNNAGPRRTTHAFSKAYNCTPGNPITITPQNFLGTINTIEWYVLG